MGVGNNLSTCLSFNNGKRFVGFYCGLETTGPHYRPLSYAGSVGFQPTLECIYNRNNVGIRIGILYFEYKSLMNARKDIALAYNHKNPFSGGILFILFFN